MLQSVNQYLLAIYCAVEHSECYVEVERLPLFRKLILEETRCKQMKLNDAR